MSYRNIYEMSVTEINILLQSNRYIPEAIKQLLQEKLVAENESIGSSIDTKPILIEDFPEINPSVPNSLPAHKTTLQFGKLFSQQILTETKESIKDTKALFQGNRIVISYDEIQKMYRAFALDRIHIYYAYLNFKINFLDAVHLVNPNGIAFKKKFDRELLVREESRMRVCLKMCFKLKYLLYCLESIINILAQYRSSLVNGSVIFLDEEQINILDYCDGEEFFWNSGLDEIISIIKNSSSSLNIETMKKSISHCHQIEETIRQQFDSLVQKYDPDIACEYIVSIIDHENNRIVPVGLNHFIYREHSEIIDLSTKNISYPDSFLKNLAINDVVEIFGERKKSTFVRTEPNYFMDIRTKPKRLFIRYTLDTDLPQPKMVLQINGLPAGTLLFSSLVKKICLDFVVPPCPYPSVQTWLNENNILHTNTIFNELMVQDQTKTIITPKMLDSFRRLAQTTTKCLA